MYDAAQISHSAGALAEGRKYTHVVNEPQGNCIVQPRFVVQGEKWSQRLTMGDIGLPVFKATQHLIRNGAVATRVSVAIMTEKHIAQLDSGYSERRDDLT